MRLRLSISIVGVEIEAQLRPSILIVGVETVQIVPQLCPPILIFGVGIEAQLRPSIWIVGVATFGPLFGVGGENVPFIDPA